MFPNQGFPQPAGIQAVQWAAMVRGGEGVCAGPQLTNRALHALCEHILNLIEKVGWIFIQIHFRSVLLCDSSPLSPPLPCVDCQVK